MTTHDHDFRKRAKETNRAQKPLAPSANGLTPQTIQRAQLDSSRMTPADVTALQRSVGNAAVSQMLGNGRQGSSSGSSPVVQRKLEVGPVDDRYEREADKIAKTMQGASTERTSASVQRDPVGPEGGQLNGDVESRLRQSQSSGSSLPDGVRSQLEPKLGADLSSVKVHTDSKAVQLTKEMGAKAFTHKNHIYYGKGHSPSDVKLTAHESVHTIQQGAVAQTTQRKPDEEK